MKQNSIYKIRYLLFLSWDWEAWCLTQSGGGNTNPPERNTDWNKGRKCFHCLGAPNNLICPCLYVIISINHPFCILINLRRPRNDVVSPWLQLWFGSICTEKCNGRPVWWCAWVCTLPDEVNTALYLRHTLLYSPVCCGHLHLTVSQFLEAMSEVLDRRPCQQGQHSLTHSGIDPLHPPVAASISTFVVWVTGGTNNYHVNQSNQKKQTEFFCLHNYQQSGCRVGGLWDQTPTSNI